MARNEIEIIINATDRASSVLDGMLNKVSGIGTNLMKIGAGITAATAPIALALGGAVSSAMAFDESMTNVGAVLGKGRAEMEAMNEQVLRLGANSRAGPQEAADAFYDIVGGVADASSHMAILEASIKTAEAGSAELGATTNALIAVMNSYGFAASDASFASDVLTRTVGMGVGTMDQFASALPSVTGLAHSLDIGLGDLAAATAYLTTKGNTASQATTQLSAMMTAMLKPNESMKKGLQDLGYESGEAAVKQLGLVGAMYALSQTATAQNPDSNMAVMLSSSEALRGSIALTEAGFRDFSATFKNGIEGATAAAQAIQLESPAAKFDLLMSKISAMGIVVGGILIPPLLKLADAIMPVVNQVLTWAQTNPEVMTTIVGIALAAVAAGPVIGAMGLAITAVTTAAGILLSPAVLLAGAIAAIVAAAQIGYPGGIVGLFNDAATTAQQLAFLGLYVLKLAADTVRTAIEGVTSKVNDVITVFKAMYDQSPEIHDALNKVAIFAGVAVAAFLALKVIYGGVAVAQGILSAGAWALAAAKAAVATASTAAAGGFTAFAAAASAALLPIMGVAAAIGIVIAGVNEFNRASEEGRKTAESVVAAKSASGQLTDEQLWQQVKASTVAQYGGDNPIVDGIARGIYDDLKSKMVTPTVAGAKAGGGHMMGGRNYLVGEKGPEIVRAPDGGAMVTPNNEIGSKTGGGQPINNIYVSMPEAALASPGAAMAMGREFGAGIAEEMKNRGIGR